MMEIEEFCQLILALIIEMYIRSMLDVAQRVYHNVFT